MQRILKLATLPVVLCGCYTTSVVAVPGYGAALKLGGPPKPLVYEEHEINWELMPSIVKYAVITGVSGDRSTLPRGVEKAASKIAADVLILSQAAAIYSGSIMVYGSYGGFSIPTYTHVLFGTCFRTAPARTGFRTDGRGVIITMIPDARAKQGGLQEGDRVLSLDNHPLDYGPAILEWKPGQKVRAVFVRPQTGRLEADIELLPNPAIWPTIEKIEPLRNVSDDDNEGGAIIRRPPGR
jgi:hypothetical protein